MFGKALSFPAIRSRRRTASLKGSARRCFEEPRGGEPGGIALPLDRVLRHQSPSDPEENGGVSRARRVASRAARNSAGLGERLWDPWRACGAISCRFSCGDKLGQGFEGRWLVKVLGVYLRLTRAGERHMPSQHGEDCDSERINVRPTSDSEAIDLFGGRVERGSHGSRRGSLRQGGAGKAVQTSSRVRNQPAWPWFDSSSRFQQADVWRGRRHGAREPG